MTHPRGAPPHTFKHNRVEAQLYLGDLFPSNIAATFYPSIKPFACWAPPLTSCRGGRKERRRNNHYAA
ncbi:hypothetical protein BHE74_00057162 [Ensete ventricosum]|uniref:Uncharacterized protein n=1 Tax=Ensete ventricosum TaxID=4639 RepID=A0A426XFS0_ENSVE|nr:hypothetical protein B296_00056132 [Ensete ventricosum]RWV93860.1 hypothetical protein GW17_00043651 [Ensete ventricosum]RWW37687.1 hypothetical protein BHE74_00057162 [Ensete ventricosum]RZR75336.1 hypothetical protein BHM03_00055083 [Ensete ventricosum]